MKNKANPVFTENKHLIQNGCNQLLQKLKGMPWRLVSVMEALIVNIKICKDRLNPCYHIFTGPVILGHQVLDT